MTDFQQNSTTHSATPSLLPVDSKRILYWSLRFWYLIVLSLIVALSVAFIINRYSKRIYLVTASIIIREEGEISGSEMLYNNPLVNMQRNFLNELYVIKSYPLVENVLRKLNFGVAFYKEGNFLTSEVYEVPIDVSVLNGNEYLSSPSFVFTCLEEDKFCLGPITGEAIDQKEYTFRFNDTVRINGLEAIFKIKDARKLKQIEKSPLLFKYTSPALLAPDYVGRLSASWAQEGAGVINLSISGSNPEKERDFINGFISYYQQFDLDKKNETAAKTIEFISNQLEDISDSLKLVENQLEKFKDKHIVTEMGAETMRLYNKIENLEVQRVQLVLSGNYYKYLTDYLTKGENLDQIILPTSFGVSDPILTSLISQLVERQMTLKMISQTENPGVTKSRQKINDLKRDIIESVNNLKATDKIKQDYLNEQIADAEKQLGYLPVAERNLVSIQRNYGLLEKLYVFMLQKRSEAAITQASSTSDIVKVNPPMAGRAISPRTFRNYVLAGFIGLALPLLVFVALELLNTRVQSREDIEKIITIPFIGGVGHKRGGSNLEVLNSSKTAIAESFRALRANLNYFIGKKENVVILVTSSISGEGKTFTSINLASVLALSGKKVLIVGADLRKPKIHLDFGLSNETGLSTYLSGMKGWKEVVLHTAYNGLDMLCGGPVPPNPAELLLSPAMEKFIAEARQQYDYVIVDTPPVAIVADAFSLTSFADHTLFLVRQNYTPKDLLKTTQDFFVTGKLTNVSLVLNDIYRSGPGYGNGSYAYGYGHEKNHGYGYYA